MKTFFTAMGGAILGVILGVIALAAIAMMAIGGAISSFGAPPAQSDRMVLELDLRSLPADQSAKSGPEMLFGGGDGFIDILTKLEAAATDERVISVFVRSSEMGVGSSRAEELRQRFLALKAAGKPVIVHSQGTYDGGVSTYRAIAAAEEIWVQPGADLIAPGVAFETLFLKGLFDKLSISPQFEAFHEYKNAPSTYTETDYTAPHRLAMSELANALWSESLLDIAADRGLSAAAVLEALSTSPIGSAQMVELGLANTESWPEDAMDFAIWRGLTETGDTDLNFAAFTEALVKDPKGREATAYAVLSLAAYMPPETKFGAPVIAVVGGQGPILTGLDEGSVFSQGAGFASDTIARALLGAAQDESVKAIVFRVDSPGGSPTASDQIWRAIERIQTDYDKPVVVSMASVAASGGYYVSTGADWIVANRTTITGSIGIFGGKFAISEGLARIGVNAESIQVGGPFTGAFSTTEALNQEQRALMRAWLQRGYDRFISLVAEGRGMTVAETDAVARGRVWSGSDALKAGLVDQLGTFNDAVDKAIELAELGEGTEVRVVEYPLTQGGFPLGNFGAGASAQASLRELQTMGDLAALLHHPEVQALIAEAQAAQNSRMQARLPAFNER